MSFPFKLFIAVAVWLLYFLLVYYGCRDELCDACGKSQGITEVVESGDSLQAAIPSYPIYFKWSDPKAYTDPRYDLDSMKQVILRGMGETNILKVTGKYFEEEGKAEGFDNLGFARATQVRELLGKALPDGRFEFRAQTMDEREGVRQNPFDAFSYEWVEPEATVSETVEELEDRIIMRFPYGSTEKEYDAKVEEYLDKLAERVKKTGEKITLTGHTDNSGSEEFNIKLGQGRANGIRNLLVKKGVPAALITVSSKGESQPVASNDTEAGQRENRRVELRLIKKQ
ncbi:MAG: OmpA family protein [Phaeodactylibacter sp.]|nr:OmpA family protein [Phaeodactylibacter sp.]MCB9303839.1 OmpA family protein [Lewinellaceae bacterium]